jgi:hypothetical protein
MDSPQDPAHVDQDQGQADAGEDQYVDMADVVERVLNEDDVPSGPIERVEIVAHASGDATWRVWTPRAEEPIGGYLSSDDLTGSQR